MTQHLGARLLYIFLVAFILIMVGELADKSQLLALLLATRYKAWQVLIGIFIATFVVHFFTALAGQLLGSAIPPRRHPVDNRRTLHRLRHLDPPG